MNRYVNAAMKGLKEGIRRAPVDYFAPLIVLFRWIALRTRRTK